MNVRSALALYENDNPFCRRIALRHSNYSAPVAGRLVRVLDFKRPSARASMAHSALRGFIRSDGFPCVAARSVVNRSTYRFGYYGPLWSEGAPEGLARDLCAFLAERRALQPQYSSFMATFEDEGGDESAFEAGLWRLLARLRAIDEPHFAYARGFSSDPRSSDYAFSFAAEACFVVGMHPRASRKARRFAYPTIVFNPHDQFQALRDGGLWTRFQSAIRARDLALQGTLNPNLADFGTISEARQYSGKAVDPAWTCPFHQD